MLRLLSTLAVVLSAVATPAHAVTVVPASTTLDRDGIHARFTTSLLAGDIVAIRGEVTDTHEPLDLTVDTRGRVSGSIGASSVEFTVPIARRDALVLELKQPTPVTATSIGTTTEASLH